MIKAEEFYSFPDFVIIEKQNDVDLFDIDEASKSLRVVSMSETVRSLARSSLHISRNISARPTSNPDSMFILHLNFPKKAFIVELDFFANLQNLEELAVLEKQVTGHLNRMFLPNDSLVDFTFKLHEGKLKLSGLVDLLQGRPKDTKIVSIEVTDSDFTYVKRKEVSVYFK